MGDERRSEDGQPSEEEYELMLLLDRLETIREEMDELGIRNLEELEARIQELHRRLGEPANGV